MLDDRQDETVADEVEYRWSPWRYAAARFVIGALGAGSGLLLLYLVFSAMAGGSVVPDLIGIVVFAVIYVPGFAGFSVLFAHSYPPQVRLSSAGVQLAAVGRDAVFVPWSATASIRIRGPWPVTALQVTVLADDAASTTRVFRGGRRPWRRRRRGRVRFAAEVTGLTASPAAIRTELRRCADCE